MLHQVADCVLLRGNRVFLGLLHDLQVAELNLIFARFARMLGYGTGDDDRGFLSQLFVLLEGLFRQIILGQNLLTLIKKEICILLML